MRDPQTSIITLRALPRVHRTVAIGPTVDIRDAMLKAE